jgi:hypothetical protein
MMGVVVPYPTLDGYHDPQFSNWLTVAYVYLDGHLYNSGEKHNLLFSPPIPGSQPNKLEIFAGMDVTKSEGTWLARYAGSPSATFTVKFRPHRFAVTSGYHIPGTTRWRWQPDDETTWARCPHGCCESN